MAKRKKIKKSRNYRAKSWGLGFIVLISIAVMLSSFNPEIKSTHLVQQDLHDESNQQDETLWPQQAPQVELLIHNKTKHRIKATYANDTIGYINPYRCMATSILAMNDPINQEGNEWELTELYRFSSPSRQVYLKPSLYIANNQLKLSCPHCHDIRTPHVGDSVNVYPDKKYQLLFTIDGNKFEHSSAQLKPTN